MCWMYQPLVMQRLKLIAFEYQALEAKIRHFDRLHCCCGNLLNEKDDHDLFTNDWTIFT